MINIWLKYALEQLYRQIYQCKNQFFFLNKSNSKHIGTNKIENLVDDDIINDKSVNREEISESEVWTLMIFQQQCTVDYHQI